MLVICNVSVSVAGVTMTWNLPRKKYRNNAPAYAIARGNNWWA